MIEDEKSQSFSKIWMLKLSIKKKGKGKQYIIDAKDKVNQIKRNKRTNISRPHSLPHKNMNKSSPQHNSRHQKSNNKVIMQKKREGQKSSMHKDIPMNNSIKKETRVT